MILSWSGGKDSCLACYKAIQSGYQISHLVNFISAEYKRVSFHGTPAELIQLQAEAIGIPLVRKKSSLMIMNRHSKKQLESFFQKVSKE